MGALLHAIEQDVEFGAKPHGYGLGAHQGTRLVVYISTAAGREHQRGLIEQAGNHAALASAKLLLAVLFEEFRDGAACGPLDFVVGVHERQAKPCRQPLTDGALARAHQPDEGHGARQGQGRRGVHGELPLACRL